MGKKQTVAAKREQEKRIVTEMIRLYCRRKHGTRGDLCPQCAELAAYARSRSNHCPFMEEKTFCSNCRVHCYSQEMREKIRQVMRFSGPRMLFYHPGMALHHVWATVLEKRRLRKAEERQP